MKTVTKQTFQIFWQHARPYKKLITVMLFATTCGMVLETIIPLFYKRFFDALGENGNTASVVQQLKNVILMILLLNSIEWVVWRVTVFANNYFQPRVMADITNTCFNYLHNHSYGFFINRFVGALVRKVNRLVNAFEAIADKLYWDLVPMAIRIAAVLIVLWTQSVTLALILFGWTLVYLAVNYAFTLYKLKYDEEHAKVDSQVTAQLADTITNNVNIKLFTMQRSEQREFDKLTEKQFKIRKFTWDLSGYMEAVQVMFMVMLEFVVFWVAIQYWSRGEFTIGDFVLVQAYLLQLFNRLWDFGRVIREMYRHLADAEEMVEILNTPHAVQDKLRAKKLVVHAGDIEFRDVLFTYTKTRNVLKDFSLRIHPGERVGLVGPSGAGKSTITAVLFRFFDLTDGSISIDGQNIADVTQDSLRNNISLVPQDPILFHRTLMENIRYGRLEATDTEVLRAAKLAHCDEFIQRLPEKYETYVGERGIKLSGGERQRVAIARAILKNAPILVLDEATSSLDSHSEKLIQDALEKLMKGKTTIVIAHRLSTIMKMDRIIVIKDGQIVEQGTHRDLLGQAKGVYQKLWTLQAGGFIQ